METKSGGNLDKDKKQRVEGTVWSVEYNKYRESAKNAICGACINVIRGRSRKQVLAGGTSGRRGRPRTK